MCGNIDQYRRISNTWLLFDGQKPNLTHPLACLTSTCSHELQHQKD